MERGKVVLESSKEESESVLKLAVNPQGPYVEQSFYEDFALRGLRVDRVEPGLVVCSFRVPPRLIDKSGNLAPGAIANLVDDVGNAAIYTKGSGFLMNVSVNMSISYVSTAKADDELEVSSRLLGQKGFISGTVVLIKNKATGECIAEGRHVLFSKSASKI